MTFTAYPDTDDAPIASIRPSINRALVMEEIRTRIQVGPDHTITGIAPPDVPPGEHNPSPSGSALKMWLSSRRSSAVMSAAGIVGRMTVGEK